MQTHAIHQTPILTLLIGAALLMSFVPLTAQAAYGKKPSCTLTVTTEQGEININKKNSDILIAKGQEVKIEWAGKNATEATLNGDEVGVSDSEEFSPTAKTSYEFRFMDDGRTATCKVIVHVVEGSINELSSPTSKPAISGEATGNKKVTVAIYKDGATKPVFQKKNVSVKKGKWSVKVAKSLAGGDYEIRLYGDKKYALSLIATADLTVTSESSKSDGSKGEKNSSDKSDSDKKSSGILAVSTVPLLFGGTANVGSSISVSAIQLRNAGKEDVHVKGFTLKQQGTGSADAVTLLSVSDNLGGSRANSATNPFKNGSGFVPVDAVIAPGQLKIFTVKATLGGSVKAGTTFLFDVASVKTNGSAKGKLPLRGPTWTIGF